MELEICTNVYRYEMHTKEILLCHSFNMLEHLVIEK